MRKSISLVTCAGKVPAITVSVMMPLGTILSFMKLTRGGERPNPFLIQLHLLKRRQVDDICRASVVDEHPMDVELFYSEHDY